MARIIGSFAITPVVTPRPVRLPLTTLALKAATGALNTLYLWQSRFAERQHLGALDDRLLADMGLSRADVEGEAGKPFWRA